MSAPAILVKMAEPVRISSTDFPVPALNTSMELCVNSVTKVTNGLGLMSYLIFFIMFQANTKYIS